MANADTTMKPIQPFQLVSSFQRNTIEVFMMEVSGLRRSQIAFNSWGFPAIPIPAKRTGNGKIRLAPDNVSPDYLGHPIYWIDPAITEFEADETEDQWSIRMFYVIAAYGLWTADYSWSDYLALSGFNFDESEIRAYHATSSPVSELDRFPLLTLEQFQSSPVEVDNAYRVAIAACNDALRKNVGEFLGKQATALSQSKQILTSNYLSPNSMPDDPAGFWFQKLQPMLLELSQNYDSRLKSSTPQMYELVDPAQDRFVFLQQTIVAMNQMVAILAVPVLRSGSTDSETFAQMTTYLMLTNEQAAYRDTGYKFVDRAVTAISDNWEPGALEAITLDGYSEYRAAWRRLRLAVLNYERLQEGLPAYSNYTELEVSLVGSEQAIRTDPGRADMSLDLDRFLEGR